MHGRSSRAQDRAEADFRLSRDNVTTQHQRTVAEIVLVQNLNTGHAPQNAVQVMQPIINKNGESCCCERVWFSTWPLE